MEGKTGSPFVDEVPGKSEIKSVIVEPNRQT